MRARTVLAAGILACAATLLLGSGAAQARHSSPSLTTRDVASIFSTTGPNVTSAWSALTRTPVRGKDAVATKLETSGLVSGTAYTMWWVIFNNPNACSGPRVGHPYRCAASDLGNPAAKASVQYAGGLVASSDKATITARLGVGDKPACAAPTVPCNGLLAVRGADIQLVVRSHGPLIPALKTEQIGTFNGGCLPGEANVGLCKNVQFSMHESGVSAAKVFTNGADISPDAWSSVARSDTGLSLRLVTSGLESGSAYTVWWVIFNEPSACTAGEPLLGLRCGAKDLANPAVKASVQYAGGKVVGAGGSASFRSSLKVGDKPACAGSTIPCNGLVNPRGADVHIVVRTHGALISSLKDEQIGTFNGGCLPGEANVGQCKNVQSSPHEGSASGV